MYEWKLDADFRVLSLLYRALFEGPTDVTFTDIQKQTKIPKPSLQRVLKRLIKFGWISKSNTVYFMPLEFPEIIKSFNKEIMGSEKEENRKFSRRSINKRSKDRLWKNHMVQQILPKKRVLYFIRSFPYVFGIDKIPDGYKRSWKKHVKAFRDTLRQDGINRLQPVMILQNLTVEQT